MDDLASVASVVSLASSMGSTTPPAPTPARRTTLGDIYQFLDVVKESSSFDDADVTAVEEAISVFETTRTKRDGLLALIRDRSTILHDWGNRLDFRTTHGALGKYFLEKHKVLSDAVSAHASLDV